MELVIRVCMNGAYLEIVPQQSAFQDDLMGISPTSVWLLDQAPVQSLIDRDG